MGKQRILKLQKIVSMESPIGTLQRHNDHALSDATSREKLVLPKGTQNLDPMLRIACDD